MSGTSSSSTKLRERERERERGKGMEEIDKVARANYANMSEDEKRKARNRFAKLDTDGDGVVSRHDYMVFVKEKGYGRNYFEVLDKGGDGVMNFDKFLTLDYIHNIRGSRICEGCDVDLLGSFFSCVKCYDAGETTYDLCCECYRDKSFKHVDDHNYFVDNHRLLQIRKPNPVKETRIVLQTRESKPAPTPSNPSQRMMEELVKTAKIYYKCSSENIRESAQKFFFSLDSDGNGSVSLHEFLDFMSKQGHEKMINPQIFRDLDKEGNGTLGFLEVMALYYIIKSGRPFCGGCGDFIPDMYFTCTKCFYSSGSAGSFCLCPNCFEKGKFVHDHKYQFVDNFALLEAKRQQGIAAPAAKEKQDQIQHQKSKDRKTTSQRSP